MGKQQNSLVRLFLRVLYRGGNANYIQLRLHNTNGMCCNVSQTVNVIKNNDSVLIIGVSQHVIPLLLSIKTVCTLTFY